MLDKCLTPTFPSQRSSLTTMIGPHFFWTPTIRPAKLPICIAACPFFGVPILLLPRYWPRNGAFFVFTTSGCLHRQCHAWRMDATGEANFGAMEIAGLLFVFSSEPWTLWQDRSLALFLAFASELEAEEDQSVDQFLHVASAGLLRTPRIANCTWPGSTAKGLLVTSLKRQ